MPRHCALMNHVWWLIPAATTSTSRRCDVLLRAAIRSFLACPVLDAARDLPVRALHAVAQADRLDAAVVVAGPGVHRHRVGVVQEQRIGLGDLADVPAEVEQRGMSRWAYMIPPAQIVSPTHWSTPYFSGMSMSV